MKYIELLSWQNNQDTIKQALIEAIGARNQAMEVCEKAGIGRHTSQGFVTERGLHPKIKQFQAADYAYRDALENASDAGIIFILGNSFSWKQ